MLFVLKATGLILSNTIYIYVHMFIWMYIYIYIKN